MGNKNYSNWVWSQYFLMLSLLILSPITSIGTPGLITISIGFFLISISAITGISGVLVLGKNRKSGPEPNPDSQLITTGIYSIIRHPLYLSLILFYTGWAIIWRSVGGGIGTIVLTVFLDRKARLEEELLQKKFEMYSDYTKKTARFIPWIY